MLAWETVLNISEIFNTVICKGEHYSLSGKVQVRQHLTICYGRTSASKQREQKGRPSSLTSDLPAPGLEKGEAGQETEKGLGEFKGLLSTEWWTQPLNGVWSSHSLAGSLAVTELRRLRMADTQEVLVADAD